MPDALHITDLRISSFRGIGKIAEPIFLSNLSPGLNLIWGPNGRGKTCTAEAIGALLWGQQGDGPDVDISAQLAGAGTLSTAKLDAHQAMPVAGLPASSYAPLYRLSLHGLIRDTEGSGSDEDKLLAETIRDELYGSISLTRAAEALGFKHRLPDRRLSEFQTYEIARKEYSVKNYAQRGLYERMRSLSQMKSRHKTLERETSAEGIVKSLIELWNAKAKLQSVNVEMMSFDPRLELIRNGDNDDLTEFKQDVETHHKTIATARDDGEQAEQTVLEAGFGNNPVPDTHALNEATERTDALRDAEGAINRLTEDLAEKQRELQLAREQYDVGEQDLEKAKGTFMEMPETQELEGLQRALDAARKHDETVTAAKDDCAALEGQLDVYRASAGSLLDAEAFEAWLQKDVEVPNVQGTINAVAELATTEARQEYWQAEADKLAEKVKSGRELDRTRADGVAAMRHWVQAQTQQASGLPLMWLAFAACAVLCVSIIVLAIVAGPYWCLGLAVPTGIALWCWQINRRTVPANASPLVTPDLDSQIAPSAWRVPNVLDAISRELEACAEYAALSEQQHKAAALADEASLQVESRSATAREFQERCKAFCGIAPDKLEATALEYFVRLLGDTRQTWTELQGAQGRVESLHRQRQEAADGLFSSLERITGKRPDDIDTAEGELGRVQQTWQLLMTLIGEQDGAAEKLDTLSNLIATQQQELERRENERSTGLDTLRLRLSEYGVTTESLTDSDAAKSEIERLRSRADQDREGNRAMKDARGRAETAQTALEKYIDRSRTFCEKRQLPLAPDDWDGAERELETLLSALEAYQVAKKRLLEANGAVAQANAPLEGKDIPEQFTGLDIDALQHQLDEIETSRSELSKLTDMIKELEDEVHGAQAGHSLEAAKAAENVALGELEKQRDRIAAASVGDLLCDFLRRHTQAVTSEALNRARELFSTFTENLYELRLQDATPPVLLAFHRQKILEQPLHQLSSGNRIQLLMAARIGFLETHEPDKHPPLCLDETLAISDPERRQAMMQAVVEIVRGGRQVFYFTAQPEEISQWKRFLGSLEDSIDPKVHELGNYADARDMQQVEDWRPTPMPEPTPADTIETYGQSLSVPPLDPRAVVQDAHLWYIADSPGMLYRCLRQVSDRCGVFQSVAESRPKAELAQLLKVSGANEIDAVLRRIDILERCCELWCTGRGRPVTPDVIRESDAISETYWLETIELNQKVNGNAAALLDGLPHIPAKRALRDKLQKKLRDYLETEGYLSAEDSLTLDEALRRLRREFGDDPEIETIVQRAGLRWESYALNQGADI